MKMRDFLIVIPVADRPRQLQRCLHSLAALCRIQADGRRVEVLVLEDSLALEHRSAHQGLCQQFSQDALLCHYLDLDGQYVLRQALADRPELDTLLGDAPWPWAGHKGASLTRNLGYLRLMQMLPDFNAPLIWFVDSDQEFAVVQQGPHGVQGQRLQLPYFDELERLFADPQLQIVTGKVVGDPPVSPAVMAGTCLQDLKAFVADLACCVPEDDCSFHGREVRNATDAAYHDMADLFGFAGQIQPFGYECPVQGLHDHGACLDAATASLAAFFDGVHPSRRSWYQPDAGALSVQPARTLYTGNYVMDARGLEHCIPFASLGLRMAGPTLGRLLRARLGPGFASANLPLLHRRALEQEAKAECRPGVSWQSTEVDLSGEFQRQILGDLMLFTVEHLVGQGYPDQVPNAKQLDARLESVIEDMQTKYSSQAAANLAQVAALRVAWRGPGVWWQTLAGDDIHQRMESFLSNLERTFASHTGLFQHRDLWRAQLRVALLDYPGAQRAWRRLVGQTLPI